MGVEPVPVASKSISAPDSTAFFALERASSLQALTRSLQAFSTLAAAFAASLAGSTLAGAFGIVTPTYATMSSLHE